MVAFQLVDFILHIADVVLKLLNCQVELACLSFEAVHVTVYRTDQGAVLGFKFSNLALELGHRLFVAVLEGCELVYLFLKFLD